MPKVLNLEQKKIDIKELSQTAAKDPVMLDMLFDAIESEHNTVRYNSFKVLQQLSETHPQLLNNKWHVFVKMLESDSVYKKYVAVLLIMKLAELDHSGRFERIFNKLFSLLQGPEFIPAAHLIMQAGKIAKAYPSLQYKITHLLLEIDDLYTGNNLDVLKTHVLEAFSDYFDVSEEQYQMVAFAKELLHSHDPDTRKAARNFISRHKPAAPH